jgi:hypothetical protein
MSTRMSIEDELQVTRATTVVGMTLGDLFNISVQTVEWGPAYVTVIAHLQPVHNLESWQTMSALLLAQPTTLRVHAGVRYGLLDSGKLVPTGFLQFRGMPVMALCEEVIRLLQVANVGANGPGPRDVRSVDVGLPETEMQPADTVRLWHNEDDIPAEVTRSFEGLIETPPHGAVAGKVPLPCVARLNRLAATGQLAESSAHLLLPKPVSNMRDARVAPRTAD